MTTFWMFVDWIPYCNDAKRRKNCTAFRTPKVSEERPIAGRLCMKSCLRRSSESYRKASLCSRLSAIFCFQARSFFRSAMRPYFFTTCICF